MQHSFVDEEAGLVKPVAQAMHINKYLWNFSQPTFFKFISITVQTDICKLSWFQYLSADWHWPYRKWWNRKQKKHTIHDTFIHLSLNLKWFKIIVETWQPSPLFRHKKWMMGMTYQQPRTQGLPESRCCLTTKLNFATTLVANNLHYTQELNLIFYLKFVVRETIILFFLEINNL